MIVAAFRFAGVRLALVLADGRFASSLDPFIAERGFFKVSEITGSFDPILILLFRSMPDSRVEFLALAIMSKISAFVSSPGLNVSSPSEASVVAHISIIFRSSSIRRR